MDKCCGRSSFKYNGKKDDIIEYGRLWQHAMATPFDVESQIAQLFSSSISWTYRKNLKPKRQLPWEEFVQKGGENWKMTKIKIKICDFR